MFERFGIERSDLRNLAFVVVIVGLVMAATTDVPLVARVAVGVVGGLVSGLAFLVVTAILNAVKPEYP